MYQRLDITLQLGLFALSPLPLETRGDEILLNNFFQRFHELGMV